MNPIKSQVRDYMTTQQNEKLDETEDLRKQVEEQNMTLENNKQIRISNKCKMNKYWKLNR